MLRRLSGILAAAPPPNEDTRGIRQAAAGCGVSTGHVVIIPTIVRGARTSRSRYFCQPVPGPSRPNQVRGRQRIVASVPDRRWAGEKRFPIEGDDRIHIRPHVIPVNDGQFLGIRHARVPGSIVDSICGLRQAARSRQCPAMFRRPGPRSHATTRLPSILYPLSSILYPLSSIFYLLSSIFYLLSSIFYLLSSHPPRPRRLEQIQSNVRLPLMMRFMPEDDLQGLADAKPAFLERRWDLRQVSLGQTARWSCANARATGRARRESLTIWECCRRECSLP